VSMTMHMAGQSEMFWAAIIMLVAAIIMFITTFWVLLVHLKRQFCICSCCGDNHNMCKCGHRSTKEVKEDAIQKRIRREEQKTIKDII